MYIYIILYSENKWDILIIPIFLIFLKNMMPISHSNGIWSAQSWDDPPVGFDGFSTAWGSASTPPWHQGAVRNTLKTLRHMNQIANLKPEKRTATAEDGHVEAPPSIHCLNICLVQWDFLANSHWFRMSLWRWPRSTKFLGIFSSRGWSPSRARKRGHGEAQPAGEMDQPWGLWTDCGFLETDNRPKRKVIWCGMGGWSSKKTSPGSLFCWSRFWHVPGKLWFIPPWWTKTWILVNHQEPWVVCHILPSFAPQWLLCGWN